MTETVRVQFQSADGVKMYARVPRESLRNREIYRFCTRILRIDGRDVAVADHPTILRRRYVLWTQLTNGTYVFREDL